MWIPGTIFKAKEVDSELRKMINRVHVNLGHPSRETLMRMMGVAGASLTAIEATRQHNATEDCEEFEAEEKPKLHTRSSQG